MLLLLYAVVAPSLSLPFPEILLKPLLEKGLLAWIGILFNIVGLVGLALSLKAFGNSFRVGVPKENLFTGGGCAIIENGGDVLRGIGSDNQREYARLYVTRFLTSARGIVEAEIKYQYPFVP